VQAAERSKTESAPRATAWRAGRELPPLLWTPQALAAGDDAAWNAFQPALDQSLGE